MTKERATVRDSLYVRINPHVGARPIGEANPIEDDRVIDNHDLDNLILGRIKDRVSASRNEGGDPSDKMLTDLLSGRKPDPLKGIREVPKLFDPLAKRHLHMIREIVRAKMRAGMSPEQAIDQLLDDFKNRGRIATGD